MSYPTAALTAQRTQLQRGNGGSPEVFSSVGEITNFSGPQGQVATIDASTLESLAREFRPGLPDYGEFDFTIRFVPQNTVHRAVWDDFQNRVETRNFRLVLTDTPATTFAFTGFISAFQMGGQVDGLIEAQVKIKITGLVTIV